MSIKEDIRKKLLALGLTGAAAVSGGYLIAPNEGEVLGTYVDPVGIITACYGSTGPQYKLGMKFTQDECLSQLAKDIDVHDKAMMKLITVPITESQHAAFLSFTFNAGVTAFKNSTMLKKLNRGNYEGACLELDKWVHAGGKILPGLVHRREEERQMCLGENQ